MSDTDTLDYRIIERISKEHHTHSIYITKSTALVLLGEKENDIKPGETVNVSDTAYVSYKCG